jgi:hypothetical protein
VKSAPVDFAGHQIPLSSDMSLFLNSVLRGRSPEYPSHYRIGRAIRRVISAAVGILKAFPEFLAAISGGILEAPITTAIGLFVTIPAVMMF